MKSGDVIEVTVTATDSTSSTTFSMVHNYRVTATAGNIRTWGAEWASAYDAALKKAVPTVSNKSVASLYPTTTLFTQAVMFNLNTPTENYAQNLAVRGTDAAQAYNPRAAILTSLNTGVRGRSYRGRLFYPPVGENNVDAGGTISTDTLTVFQTFMNDIKVLGNSDENGTIAVYSRKLSTENIVFSTVVTQLTVRSNLASQRRRRRSLT